MPDDRRLGKRVEIAPVAVEWTPAIAKKRFGRRVRPEPAHIVEISISGARIGARSRERIEVGSWMVLDVDGYHAVVEVRRIADNDDKSAFVFGVAFVLLAPGLQQKSYR